MVRFSIAVREERQQEDAPAEKKVRQSIAPVEEYTLVVHSVEDSPSFFRTPGLTPSEDEFSDEDDEALRLPPRPAYTRFPTMRWEKPTLLHRESSVRLPPRPGFERCASLSRAPRSMPSLKPKPWDRSGTRPHNDGIRDGWLERGSLPPPSPPPGSGRLLLLSAGSDRPASRFRTRRLSPSRAKPSTAAMEAARSPAKARRQGTLRRIQPRLPWTPADAGVRSEQLEARRGLIAHEGSRLPDEVSMALQGKASRMDRRRSTARGLDPLHQRRALDPVLPPGALERLAMGGKLDLAKKLPPSTSDDRAAGARYAVGVLQLGQQHRPARGPRWRPVDF